MRRWLLVTKEKDYYDDKISDWETLEDEPELNFYVDQRIGKGDKVLITNQVNSEPSPISLKSKNAIESKKILIKSIYTVKNPLLNQ